MQQWLFQAKKDIKNNCKGRLMQRINEMESIIQKKLIISFQIKGFVITDNIKKKIKKNIFECIDEWRGQKNFKNEADCWKKTRKWFNRDKYKILGNYLFSPIIFDYLFKFIVCYDSKMSALSLNDKLAIFIQVLLTILKAQIKFTQTSHKPVILTQCFTNGNDFKDRFDSFIEHFGNEAIYDEFRNRYRMLKHKAKDTKSKKIKAEMAENNQNEKKKPMYIKNPDRSRLLTNLYLETLSKVNDIAQSLQDANISDRISLWYNTAMAHSNFHLEIIAPELPQKPVNRMNVHHHHHRYAPVSHPIGAVVAAPQFPQQVVMPRLESIEGTMGYHSYQCVHRQSYTVSNQRYVPYTGTPEMNQHYVHNNNRQQACRNMLDINNHNQNYSGNDKMNDLNMKNIPSLSSLIEQISNKPTKEMEHNMSLLVMILMSHFQHHLQQQDNNTNSLCFLCGDL